MLIINSIWPIALIAVGFIGAIHLHTYAKNKSFDLPF